MTSKGENLRDKVSKAARELSETERELALVRMQREEVQKTLNELLRLTKKGGPKDA